jgi:hypothetical protein
MDEEIEGVPFPGAVRGNRKLILIGMLFIKNFNDFNSYQLNEDTSQIELWAYQVETVCICGYNLETTAATARYCVSGVRWHAISFFEIGF